MGFLGKEVSFLLRVVQKGHLLEWYLLVLTFSERAFDFGEKAGSTQEQNKLSQEMERDLRHTSKH